jgi:uncharacterized protein (TIGR02246 family)
MRKAIRILAAMGLVAYALAGCATQGEAVGDRIGDVHARFEAAFAAGDAAALAALYAPDAVVMPPNLAQVEGRAAIQALWQQFFDAGVTGLDRTTAELAVDTVRATETGSLTLTGPDGQGGASSIGGKYMLLWLQSADGDWRLYREIWNNDPAG